MQRRVSTVLVISLLGTMLSLAGCKVGPDFKTPQAPVNKDWSAKGDPRVATQTTADSRWWRVFNDSALDQLVDRAYKQNLPLQVAGLRIVEARAQLGTAIGRQFPQIQFASASGSVDGASENATPAPNIDFNFIEYQLGFDAIWELDLWGKYRRGVEAGAASLVASVADYYYGILSLTAEVARTYAAIRTIEVLIELANENVRIQEQGLQIADSRYRNGATSELDVTQATTLLESTRATVPDLQARLQRARNALATLLGQTTGSIDTLLAGPKQIPKAPAKVAVGVPAEILRRRPDIRSAEFYAAAQCARVGIAKADLYPSFVLIGTIGLRSSNIGGDFRNLFAADSLYYAAGPAINWPFFTYGRTTNQVRVQDARFQQALVDYMNTVLKAAQEVEDALAGFLNSQQAVVFKERAVAAASRSVEISMVQYREGAVDYQRVLDAQQAQLEQQNSLAETRSDIAVNLIALYKALGGGWEVREGQPVVRENAERQMKERTDWGDLLTEPRVQEVTH
jgi:NodT family efflux transporter outer membrane factor (OMF) lipoprotein